MKLFYKLLLISIPVIFSTNLLAQSPSRVTIKGIIRDSSGTEQPYTTVMLLNASDSTLLNFSTTNMQGAFIFSNVRNTSYIFKTSHVSFLPMQIHLSPSETPVNDLGIITLKPISHMLMEVVVRAARAPIFIKGDTIEYDATTFKVPPGSTVEDLLRRLPGIEVDAGGNISTMGKDVRRVYVDGKTFFGDDPKSVTKNLDAQAISKVQVYDDKSESAKLTGVDDGVKEKAMNLELKEEFKKGSFGKASLAGGTEGRWAGRGSFNRFTESQQLSFIAYANNINQTGVNWEDYGEFKGQSSFGQFDNGDFGFSAGRGRYYRWGSDVPFDYFDGRGFTENYGGGVNYNYHKKETKFNTSYFYNQTDLHFDQFSRRQTYLNDTTFFRRDTLAYNEFRNAHSFNTRYENQFDSLNSLIVKANVRASGKSDQSMRSQLYSSEILTPVNNSISDNSGDLESWSLSSTAIYSHKFKKKGRAFAASAAFSRNQNDKSEELLNNNQYFLIPNAIRTINILNTIQSSGSSYKASLLYSEPLSKKWFYEVFYNFNSGEDKSEKRAGNPLFSDSRIDSLSIWFVKNTTYNRLGNILRFASKGVNISMGIAYQEIQLGAEYAIAANMPHLTPPLTRSFRNWVPNFTTDVELPRNLRLNFEYQYDISEPGIEQLQPAPDLSNPLYQVMGNPNLKPERNHSFDLGANIWNPASFSNFHFGTGLDLYDSRIIYNSTTMLTDSIGYKTISSPDNVAGGYAFNTRLWTNFPIIKTILTMSIHGSYRLDESPVFVNAIQNNTVTQSINSGTGININIGSRLILNTGYSYSPRITRYSIHQTQDQNILTTSFNLGVKWQFAKKFFFEGNMNFNTYESNTFSYNQDLQLINASVRRILGKKNRFELRLAAFDVLNNQQYIRQNAWSNVVEQTMAPTLARYYMLSLTYNIRGFDSKLNKGRFW